MSLGRPDRVRWPKPDARYMRAQRVAAVETIAAMRAEVPEDPAELERIMNAGRLAVASRGVDAAGSE
jgi:hypothetical protein